MRFGICFIVIIAQYLLCTGIIAQKPQATVELVAQNCSIHLHTDKDIYLPNETVWFKAYLASEYLPDTIHANLYTALLDEKGLVVQQKVFPIFEGFSMGSFSLNDSSHAASYFIKAYVSTIDSLNIGTPYLKAIPIVTQSNPVQVNSNSTIPKTLVQVFPEGGTFIETVPNQIAFKATYSNGLPFELRAVLKNYKGIVLDSIRSLHDGMGIFSITPQKNESYYIEWDDKSANTNQAKLPEAQEKGITLHNSQVKDFLYYVIQNPQNEGDLDNLKVIATLYNKIIYTAELDMNSTPIRSGRIPLNHLPSGLITITVYDNKMQPLAERINFCSNYKNSIKATVNVEELNLGKRGMSKLTINIPDTISSSLSVAVFDANFQSAQNSNIYSDLLLSNNIKGYLHNPSWYFSDSTIEKRNALDLVMQTNGWRRYRNRLSTDQNIENYISLEGTVFDLKNNPQPNVTMSMILQLKDSTKQYFSITTDSIGRFHQKGFYFFDTATILYQVNLKNAKTSDYRIKFDPLFKSILSEGLNSSIVQPELVVDKTLNRLVTQNNRQNNVHDGFTEKGYTLGNVTVTNNKWKKDHMLMMDDTYTSGVFKGNATAFSFDVMNDSTINAKGDILNFLISKIPGLALIYGNGGFKKLGYYRGNGSVAIDLIYIDEHKMEFDPNDALGYSELQNLNIGDIAYVKYFNRAPLEPQKPAIAIYLKKGNEIDARKATSLSKIQISGYSSYKEFYSPNYSEPQKNYSIVDARTTLWWQPNLLFNRDNQKYTFSFYNNDLSTNLIIVIEGMNEEGKLLHFEKLIIADK